MCEYCLVKLFWWRSMRYIISIPKLLYSSQALVYQQKHTLSVRTTRTVPLLSQMFFITFFRMQWKIISSIIDKKRDVCVVMSTG